MQKEGIISGRIVAMDTTSLPTLFQSDLDAKWNYDATKEEYYYGYALHVVFDAITQLTIAFGTDKETIIVLALIMLVLMLLSYFLFFR